MRSKLASSLTSQSKSCSIAILEAVAAPGASSTVPSAQLRTSVSCRMANIPTKESSLLAKLTAKPQTSSESPATTTSSHKAKRSLRQPSLPDQSLSQCTPKLSLSDITAAESWMLTQTIAPSPTITASPPLAMEQRMVSSTTSSRTRGAQIGERAASSESQQLEMALVSVEFSSMAPTQSPNENEIYPSNE